MTCSIHHTSTRLIPCASAILAPILILVLALISTPALAANPIGGKPIGPYPSGTAVDVLQELCDVGLGAPTPGMVLFVQDPVTCNAVTTPYIAPTVLPNGTVVGQLLFWNGSSWTYADDTVLGFDPTHHWFWTYNTLTDRWLKSPTNTFLGIDVLSGGGLTHTSGNEGWYNTVIGGQCGTNFTTAAFNIAIGYRALVTATTINQAVAIGAHAMEYATTGNTIAIGMNAARYITSGTPVAIGLYALGPAQIAHDTTAVGTGVMQSVTNSTVHCTAVGAYANQYGNVQHTTAIGREAGRGTSSAAIQACNVWVGSNAGNKVSNITDSVAIGYAAGGNTFTTGTNCIFIGANTDAPTPTISNYLVIGSAVTAQMDANTWTQYGLGMYTVGSAVADGAYRDLPANKSGYGWVMLGDDVAFASFAFKLDGTVRLRETNGIVYSTNTPGGLCIYDNGSSVRIHNRSGLSTDWRIDVKFY